MIDFHEKIRLLSDNELLEVIKSRDDYQQEFWDLAVIAAEKRGLKNKTDKIIEDLNKRKLKIKEADKKRQLKEYSLIELYSDKSIIIFSIFFSSIAGAILFSQNLKFLKIKGGDKVLIFGICYYVAILLLTFAMQSDTLKGLSYLLSIAGGFIITIYFGNKYYPPNMEYKNKKIWKALLITISIFVVFFGLLLLLNKIIN